jgi:hypothetical protein
MHGKRLSDSEADLDFFQITVPSPERISSLSLEPLPNIALCVQLFSKGHTTPMALYCSGRPGVPLHIPALKLPSGDYFVAVLQDLDVYGESKVVHLHENVSDPYTLRLGPGGGGAFAGGRAQRRGHERPAAQPRRLPARHPRLGEGRRRLLPQGRVRERVPIPHRGRAARWRRRPQREPVSRWQRAQHGQDPHEPRAQADPPPTRPRRSRGSRSAASRRRASSCQPPPIPPLRSGRSFREGARRTIE